MSWARPLLAAAALYNAAWVVVLFTCPERVFARTPPYVEVLAVLVGLVGACFAVNAGRRTPLLLAAGLVAKCLGPAIFVAAVLLGYLSPSAWPLTLANDVLWIPPLAMLLKRGRAW